MGSGRPKFFSVIIAGTALGLAGPIYAADAAETVAAISEARPPLLPVEAFAQRDLISNPTMSPDGKRVATLVTLNGQKRVAVLDLGDKQQLAAIGLGGDVEYGWHRWAGSDIVLVSVSQMVDVLGEDTRVSRLMALQVSTGKNWLVGPRSMGVEGDDLLHVSEDGSSVLLSFQKTIYDWPSVTRISLLDPKDAGRQVQRAVEGIWEWYADDQGVVRMGTGWSSGKMRVTYRKTAEDRFREIARIGEDDKEKLWDISRIVGGSDEAYVVDED
jgi:hypothetical protein